MEYKDQIAGSFFSNFVNYFIIFALEIESEEEADNSIRMHKK